MQPLPRYKSWPKPSTLNSNCFMYIIGEEDGPYYKVGIGHHPEKRLIEVQAGNPRTLRFFRKWDVRPWSVRVESGAHLILSPHQWSFALLRLLWARFRDLTAPPGDAVRRSGQPASCSKISIEIVSRSESNCRRRLALSNQSR